MEVQAKSPYVPHTLRQSPAKMYPVMPSPLLTRPAQVTPRAPPHWGRGHPVTGQSLPMVSGSLLYVKHGTAMFLPYDWQAC